MIATNSSAISLNKLNKSSIFEDNKAISPTSSSYPHSLKEEPIVSSSSAAGAVAARQSNGNENAMENVKRSESNQVVKLRGILKLDRNLTRQSVSLLSRRRYHKALKYSSISMTTVEIEKHL